MRIPATLKENTHQYRMVMNAFDKFKELHREHMHGSYNLGYLAEGLDLSYKLQIAENDLRSAILKAGIGECLTFQAVV